MAGHSKWANIKHKNGKMQAWKILPSSFVKSQLQLK